MNYDKNLNFINKERVKEHNEIESMMNNLPTKGQKNLKLKTNNNILNRTGPVKIPQMDPNSLQ